MTGERQDSQSELKSTVNRGLAWVGLASSMVGVLDILAYGLIVALWVTKAELGTAALAIILFPVLDIATDLGLAAAVIQRDNHSQRRISTVFWLNVAMSLFLLAVLAFGIGPLLVFVFNKPIVASMLMVYGAKLVWQNVYFLPYALMKRELRFKELSVIRIVANFAEFAGKVGSAAAGVGVWCFVIGPLCRVVVTGIGVQLRNPWRPSFVFHFREGWEWAAFGLKTSGHKILFRIYTLADKYAVGLYFGDAALGVYHIAYMVVMEPALVISEITTNVAFPTFSRLKHDAGRLYQQLVDFCRMNLVVMLVFLGFVFVAAEEVMAIFSQRKGNDYSSGAPMIRILCGAAMLQALSYVFPPFLDGVGKPSLTLLFSTVATIVLTGCFFAFGHSPLADSMGPGAVALGWLCGYPVAFAVLVFMAFRVLNMSSLKFYSRLFDILLCGAVATAMTAMCKISTLGQPATLRVALMALVMVVSFGFMLQKFAGISIASVRKAMSGK